MSKTLIIFMLLFFSGSVQGMNMTYTGGGILSIYDQYNNETNLNFNESYNFSDSMDYLLILKNMNQDTTANVIFKDFFLDNIYSFLFTLAIIIMLLSLMGLVVFKATR